MTFKELNAALIPKAETLCALLLPGGRREGREWIAASTEGGNGRSLKVVLEGAKAGVWKDFASDEGGDLLNLIELNQKTDAKGAAGFARDFLGLPPWEPDKSIPPPFDPLSMGFKRSGESEWRKGTAAWTYRDSDGNILCHAVRFDFGQGKKDVLPMRLINGKWRWKGFAAPAKPPIYGLDRLAARPEAPVLIVEGEKTADAAAKLFPGHVVLSWLGGCKAVKKVDWTPVERRQVVLWPDADEPGRKAMAYLHQRITGAVLVATSDLPEGWDLADPPPEGFDAQGRLDGAKSAAEVRAAKLEAKEREDAERSEEERYHLPPGCELSAVEGDLLKYGVFEYGNKVWTVYDNRGARGKWAVEVSNCTVQIHQHIITKDGALALVTFRNQVEGETTTMDIPFDQLSTSLGFVKLLANRGNFQWFGTDSAFTGYRRLLMDRMGKGRIITELGTQPEGFFVFSNAMVNSAIHPLDKHGCFSYKGASYYVPSGNNFYQGDAEEFCMQKRMVLSIGSKLTFGQWCRQMVRCYDEHAYMAITFAMATAFSCYIHSRLDGFPLLFLHGPGGSGKDQLIKFAQGLFGRPQPEIFLSGPNTDKGMIKMFAEFNDIPLNLAEYRNGLKKDMDEFLKSLWGRIGYRMAAMRGKRTETIPIRCSAFVSGNDYPNRDNALMRRLLIDEVEKKPRTSEDIAEYQRLKEMAREGYSHLLADILKHREAFERDFMDQFKAARPVILEALEGSEVDDAILTNMQVLVAVRRFFDSRLEWAFTTDQLAAYMAKAMRVQLAKRSEGSEVANFWTCFVHATRAGKLVQDRDFKIIGNIIQFYWGAVYPAYAESHQRVFGEKAERTSDMRAKLERHPCFMEAPKSARIGYRNSSAVQCNMELSGTNLVQLLNLTGGEVAAPEMDLPF